MCDAPSCEGICSFFTPLVAGYFRATPRPPAFEAEPSRRRFMTMDVTDAPDAATEGRQFAEFLNNAHLVSLTPPALRSAIALRCGFTEAVENWALGVIPNGWTRKVILTAAEEIIRAHGAEPELSLLAA